MDAGYKIYRGPVSRDDLQVEWRVDVIFLVNLPATKLSRDFVECGVDKGNSLFICRYVDFNRM